MCDQVFVGSGADPLRRCSPPLPVLVIANRGAAPALTVRNMLLVVPEPKSKIRDQVVVTAGLTQVEIVKSFRPLTMPVGRDTYCPEPLRLSALPSLPGTREIGAPGRRSVPAISGAAISDQRLNS